MLADDSVRRSPTMINSNMVPQTHAFLDSNSSSLSPDTSPLHHSNSTDHITERLFMKRRLVDSSDDEMSRDAERGPKTMRESPVNNGSSEIKCPCCAEFMSPKSFSEHACFKNICSQVLPKDFIPFSPMPSPNAAHSGDLDILFSIFKGSMEFRGKLIEELKKMFPNNINMVMNSLHNIAALAIELFCQEDENILNNNIAREKLFNFKELKTLQKATTNNQCTSCEPIRNFVLPGNKSLHMLVHHSPSLTGGDSNILTVKQLLNCIDSSLNHCLDNNMLNAVNCDSNNTVKMLQRLFEKSSNLENCMNLFFPKQGNAFNWESIFNSLSQQLNKPVVNPQISPDTTMQDVPIMSGQQQNNTSKRGRTRLTAQQLSILRSYFDINNSPTEEKIMEICSKTGLQEKVVKHWFRNTLFKERQRNKDNPYNFSVPPSTSLNLEEYEKTGKIEVKPAMNQFDKGNSSSDSSSRMKNDVSDASQEMQFDGNDSPASYDGSNCSDKKRSKFCLSNQQSDALEQYFRANPQPTKLMLDSVAKSMFLPKKYIQNFYDMWKRDNLSASNQNVSTVPKADCPDISAPVASTGEWSNPLGFFMNKPNQVPFNFDPLMKRIQPNLLQGTQILPSPLDKTVNVASGLSDVPNITEFLMKKSFLTGNGTDDRPLDLSSQNLLTHPNLTIPFGIPPQLQTPDFLAASLSMGMKDSSESIDDESINGAMFGLDKGMSVSQANMVSSSQSQQSRRNRTSISNFQSKCMFAIYEYHKTPSVQECDRLGDYIGLTRRVVQVWFQNQRAKEKKMARVSNSMQAKLNQSNPGLNGNNPPLNLCTNNACLLCGVAITGTGGLDDQSMSRPAGSKCDRRLIEHLFTTGHLDKLTNLYSKELKINNSNSGSTTSVELDIV